MPSSCALGHRLINDIRARMSGRLTEMAYMGCHRRYVRSELRRTCRTRRTRNPSMTNSDRTRLASRSGPHQPAYHVLPLVCHQCSSQLHQDVVTSEATSYLRLHSRWRIPSLPSTHGVHLPLRFPPSRLSATVPKTFTRLPTIKTARARRMMKMTTTMRRFRLVSVVRRRM
jgi:hypothetical protein